MPGFGQSDVLLRMRSRRGLAVVVGVVVPLLLGVVSEIAESATLHALVGLLIGLEAIVFFFLPAIAPDGILTGERRGALKADHDGLVFRGRRILTRDQVRNVAVEPQAGGAQIVRVSAHRVKDDVDIELADDAQARALLAALELAYDEHVAIFAVEEAPLRSAARAFAARALVVGGALAIVAVVLFVSRQNELLLLALAPLLLVYALVIPRARVHTDVVLGADGLTLRLRGQLRSLPHASIVETTSARSVATLVLQDGEEVRLRFAPDEDKGSVQCATFVARLRRARTHLELADAGDPVEALLARGQRAPGEWLRDLRALGGGERGYRVANVPVETLWRVVETAASEPTARVGAIVALRERDAVEDARPRLLALAEQTAGRDLRAALEAAADGETEEAIVAAYERAGRS